MKLLHLLKKILRIFQKSDETIKKPLINSSTIQQSTKKNMTYAFSKKSKSRLETCHKDLQLLFNEIIKYKDCSILEGSRTAERQAQLYLEKKSKLDGVNKISNHQVSKERPLSYAVDVMPYPINWKDYKGHQEFADFVFKKADELNIKVVWGGNWKSFKDNPHWELNRLHYV